MIKNESDLNTGLTTEKYNSIYIEKLEIELSLLNMKLTMAKEVLSEFGHIPALVTIVKELSK